MSPLRWRRTEDVPLSFDEPRTGVAAEGEDAVWTIAHYEPEHVDQEKTPWELVRTDRRTGDDSSVGLYPTQEVAKRAAQQLEDGRTTQESPMSRKKKKPSEPTPEEEGQQILADAEKAGTAYAQEQVGSPYFRDWVHDQMAEAEAMHRRDPSSVITDFRKIARNMLQQLEWDVKRDLDPRTILELSGAKGVFDVGSADWVRDKYGITYQDVSGAFFGGFDQALRAPSMVQWLTDLLLEISEETRKGAQVSESTRTRRGSTSLVQSIIDSGGSADYERLKSLGWTDRQMSTAVHSGALRWSPDGSRLEVVRGGLDRNGHVDPQTWAEEAHGGSMSANDFITALQAQLPADRRTNIRFQKSLGGPRGGSVYVNFINLPAGVGGAGGGAEAENNRASFWVNGFDYDPAVPVAKVKAEQSNSVFHRAWLGAPAVPFRAKAGAPEDVAHYLADYLRNVVETVPPRFTHTTPPSGHAVRDYVAVDPRGRTVAGPFTDYGEAKREADRARGYVKYATGRSAHETGSRPHLRPRLAR